MRKLVALIVICLIGFLAACAIFEQVRTPVAKALFAAGGATAVTLGGFWDTITASPIYQTYHMLIWFVGGIIFLYAFQRLLRPRIPKLRKTTPAYDISLQTEPPPSPPVIVKQTVETPKEEVAANA